MKFGYTIANVPDVDASLTFYEQAFGLPRRFLHESGTHGELDTGETTLAFASHELGHANFPDGHVAASDSPCPLGIEVALVTTDVATAHRAAVTLGAIELSAPQQKPWGQVVPYVRVRMARSWSFARRFRVRPRDATLQKYPQLRGVWRR